MKVIKIDLGSSGLTGDTDDINRHIRYVIDQFQEQTVKAAMGLKGFLGKKRHVTGADEVEEWIQSQ